MNIKRYLDLAAQVSRLKDDDRTYFHGAVGIRKDGVLVAACNGSPKEPTPEHHCEYRLSRKLGKAGTVFLVRTAADGRWADSTPCSTCQARMRNKKVRRVYFSTGPGDWRLWDLKLQYYPPAPMVGLDAWLPQYTGISTLLQVNKTLHL